MNTKCSSSRTFRHLTIRHNDNFCLKLILKTLHRLGGLASALTGASLTVLTDLVYTLPSLKASAQATLGSGWQDLVKVHMLDWNDPKTYYQADHVDVVIAADVAWLDHLVDPLLRTIDASVGPSCIFILAHQSRSLEVDTHFLEGLRKIMSLTAVRADGKITIYQGRRKD